MSNNELKFCVNCKWFDKRTNKKHFYKNDCYCLRKWVDLVTGIECEIDSKCTDERNGVEYKINSQILTSCGPEGKYFEPLQN